MLRAASFHHFRRRCWCWCWIGDAGRDCCADCADCGGGGGGGGGDGGQKEKKKKKKDYFGRTRPALSHPSHPTTMTTTCFALTSHHCKVAPTVSDGGHVSRIGRGRCRWHHRVRN